MSDERKSVRLAPGNSHSLSVLIAEDHRSALVMLHCPAGGLSFRAPMQYVREFVEALDAASRDVSEGTDDE